LGETFELVMPGKFKFLAEQVSHHPPITAIITIGDAGYKGEIVYRAKNKFSKGNLMFSNIYKEYMTLTPWDEKYELVPVPISVHNLIIGSPYLDAGSKSYVKNLACPND
jgi:hypothetical protein